MSTVNTQEECKKFWAELERQFSNIGEFIVGNQQALANYINGVSGEDGCKNPSIKAEEWKKYSEKLKNLDKATQAVKEKEELQTQLSGSQHNTVMASTLGPASGIGAGLSLFPLLAKFLKR